MTTASGELRVDGTLRVIIVGFRVVAAVWITVLGIFFVVGGDASTPVVAGARALFPRLIALLEHGGFLVYETYTLAHLSLDVSGPRNPAYLLQPGELETLVAPLSILEYREGLRRDAAGERHVASVLARKDA